MIFKIKDEEINNLDDMFKLFSFIAKKLGRPIKSMDIELKDSWGNLPGSDDHSGEHYFP
jgi:hypothetical protein